MCVLFPVASLIRLVPPGFDLMGLVPPVSCLGLTPCVLIRLQVPDMTSFEKSENLRKEKELRELLITVRSPVRASG